MTETGSGSIVPLEADEWFEVSDKDWLDPKLKGRKLKLLADAMVPQPVVDEIRAAGISLAVMHGNARRQPDAAVLSLAERKGRVLFTLDKGFWNDRRYPLHMIRTGVIYVAEPPEDADRILRAFGLAYTCFAKSYPLNWWQKMKVRARVGEFELKIYSWEGKPARYKMRLRKGRVEAKEIS